MFTKDQGKIKIMFQGAIQKNQNIIKKTLQESKTVWYTVSKKMARSLHDQSTAVLRLARCIQKATRKAQHNQPLLNFDTQLTDSMTTTL